MFFGAKNLKNLIFLVSKRKRYMMVNSVDRVSHFYCLQLLAFFFGNGLEKNVQGSTKKVNVFYGRREVRTLIGTGVLVMRDPLPTKNGVRKKRTLMCAPFFSWTQKKEGNAKKKFLGKMVSLKTSICNDNVILETCIYNASGPRSGNSRTLGKVNESMAGAILSKSATILRQNGNPQPRVYHTDTLDNGASFNSEGLPNNGIDYYIDTNTINEIFDNDKKKPYMVSISGKTIEDNIEMLHRISESDANKKGMISTIELNLACPNVIGKPIIAYDFVQMENVLNQIGTTKARNKKDDDDDKLLIDIIPPLGVKMPPYFDGPHFQQAASILNKYKHFVKYVATINTIGNSLPIDYISEAPCISSNNGFCGLSGSAVKFTALANVKKLRQHLDTNIDVIGVGGISSGIDAFEFILCGAKALQVGTCHWIEGPKCFDRIANELKQIMIGKGYTSIDDFYNKLQNWDKNGAALSLSKGL